MDRIEVNGKTFEKFIDCEVVYSAVRQIADRINLDYVNKKPVFLVVLKGAMFFAVELMKNIDLTCSMQVVTAKSYGDEMTTSGKVEINLPDYDFSGKDVIILEDIIDTGHTLKAMTNELLKQKPASLEIAVLVTKPSQRKVEVEVKYIGLEVPAKFILGMGFDYAEYGRNLKHIYAHIGD
jgi:hypoxanthine phosphoribosyltransferase